MDKKEISEFYVLALMENKITIEDIKEEYRKEVEEKLYKAIYNDVMSETQY